MFGTAALANAPVRWWSGTAITSASTTSMSFDISGAVVGEWVYAYASGKTTVTGLAATGWTTAVPQHSVGGGGSAIVIRRRKQSGDTTFTLTWTTSAQFAMCLVQWLNLDAATSDEGGAGQSQTSAANNMVTPTAQPNGSNRWGIDFTTGITSSSTNKQVTFTGNSPLQSTPFQQTYNPNTSVSWASCGVMDSSAPVATGNQSYTGVCSNAAQNIQNGAGAIMFLIPSNPINAGGAVLQSVNRAAVF